MKTNTIKFNPSEHTIIKTSGGQDYYYCPECKSTSFNVDPYKNIGHCFKCGINAIVTGKPTNKEKPVIETIEKKPKKYVKRDNDYLYEYQTGYVKLIQVTNEIDPVKRKNKKKVFWLEKTKNGLYFGAREAIKKCGLFNIENISEKTKIVFISEGEKKSQKLKSILTDSIYISLGCASATYQISKNDIKCLSGLTVYLLPDNDQPGYDCMVKMYNVLNKSLIPCKIINLPNATFEGYDIEDWINDKHTFSELLNIIEKTKEEKIIEQPKQEIEKEEEIEFSDVKNTEKFIASYGNLFRYSKELGFLFWNGKHWEIDSEIKIIGLAKKFSKEISRDILKKPTNESLKWCKYSESKSGITNMVFLSKVDCLIPMTDMNKEVYKLNLSNGVLDLKTMTLESHNKNYFFTNLLNIEYDKTKTYPKFKKFLETIFIDENGKTDIELIEYVKQILGSCLIPLVKNEHWYFCYGNGNNGKSTLFKIMESILGKYYNTINSENLMVKQNSEHSTWKAKLYDSRMVVSSETTDGTRLNESLLKELTGRDQITARFMRQDEFQFYPKFKLFTFGNYKPQVRGMDNGIWRRIKLIPFLANIPKEKIVKDLNELLVNEERSGILNWLIDGLQTLMKNNWTLEDPKIVIRATLEYKESQDTIGQFISEYFFTKQELEIFYNNRIEYHRTKDSKKWSLYEETLPKSQRIFDIRSIIDNDKLQVFSSFWVSLQDYKETVKEVYILYEKWCDENSYKPYGKKHFNENLERLGYRKVKLNEWNFKGLVRK